MRVVLLGDITDRKDNHSARLVHRVLDGIASVADVAPVDILLGNHDYADVGHPFFAFTQNYHDRVRFITQPVLLPITWKHEPQGLYIPFQRETRDFAAAIAHKDRARASVVFMHQTVHGAVTANGSKMEGPPAEFDFEPLRVFSGDIHVPQVVGQVQYCGSPYHIRFGDAFDPSIILYSPENDEVGYLEYPCLRKHVLTVAGNAGDLLDAVTHANKKGAQHGKHDQYKIKVLLDRSEFHDWRRIKSEILRECEILKMDVYGIQMKEWKMPQPRVRIARKHKYGFMPARLFDEFCEKEQIDDELKAVGSKMMA